MGEAWAGMYVGFALLTSGADQYVGYWDAQRRLVVAHRQLDGDSPWVRQVLDETLGWDSHNHISLGLDRGGHLHVSGNMHNDPMVYFRTRVPGDVGTLTRYDHLVDPGTEGSVTYPEFAHRQDGRLVFSHRNGGSGDGATYVNIYDEAAQSWRRLLETPLFDGSDRDGRGSWSAYPQGPELGPDGWFHLLWMWRETPDAATNSLLTYARSRDLVSWVDAHGRPVEVPFTYGTGDLVDPVPPRGGLLNGNARLGFGADGSVHVIYHKYDADGLSQIWAARPGGVESIGAPGSSWEIRRLTEWERRWDFGGHGTLDFEVEVFGSEAQPDGRVRVDLRAFGERRSIVMDQELRALGEGPTSPWPDGLDVVRGDFPGLQVNMLHGRGVGSGGGRYVLRWESLPENRDRPYADHPQGGPLEVVRLPEVQDGPAG
ncbi:BNR repeat-containing protein [Nesterenkonia sp. K-15-9-6]|uniref:BNR repeat-containing protein n=1 Tax=Nesterenkonia sp. K-15-9-6 TaxID=3093918 RepID=UPI00404466B8